MMTMRDIFPLPPSAHTASTSIVHQPSAHATFLVNAKPQVRECGSCTLCCKVMGINEPDFQKAKDCWCPHAKKGQGCGIYETRPAACRSFHCLWLQGHFGGLEFRPDKIHAVITATTDGRNWVVHEDPGYSGVARTILRDMIESWIKQSKDHYVVVVNGTHRSFFGQREKFDALMAAGAPEAVGARNVVEKGTTFMGGGGVR